MSEKNAKPSVAVAFDKMYEVLEKTGLSERQIILLIQDTTRELGDRQNLADIEVTMNAIRKLHNQLNIMEENQ